MINPARASPSARRCVQVCLLPLDWASLIAGIPYIIHTVHSTPQVDVLVANPLRLKTLVEAGKIDLAHVR